MNIVRLALQVVLAIPFYLFMFFVLLVLLVTFGSYYFLEWVFKTQDSH